MKDEQDYIRDITAMRSMMERSSKFMSLSGLSALLAGMYALVGALAAYKFFHFNPDRIVYNSDGLENLPGGFPEAILIALGVLILSVGTAASLSYRKASKRGDKFWNPTSRRLLFNMSVPLITGGLLILILVLKGFFGLMVPLSLLFYGIALYNASKFTYEEIRSLGLIQIFLGLLSAWLVEYELFFWAIGFGVTNIIYGFYLHYRYER